MNPYFEAIGFIAVGLNIAGNWMLANKNARGWGIRLACNAAQLLYAVLIGSPSLTASAVTFAAINVHGAVKWKRLVGHLDSCAVARRLSCNCGRFA